eukprot:6491153-Amphidinium_carterae.1
MAPKRIYEGKFRKVVESPHVFVVLLGHDKARWREELSMAPLKVVRDKVVERSVATSGIQLGSTPLWHVYGFAVLTGWSLVPAIGEAFTEGVDIASSRQVMHNLLLHQCAGGVRGVIEWPAVACAYLKDRVPFSSSSLDLEDYALTLDTPVFAQHCWRLLENVQGVHEIGDGNVTEDAITVSSLWQRWSKRFTMQSTSAGVPLLAGWRLWHPLAVLLSRGQWFGDLVALQERQSGRFAVRLLSGTPPVKLMKQYIEHKAHVQTNSSKLVLSAEIRLFGRFVAFPSNPQGVTTLKLPELCRLAGEHSKVLRLVMQGKTKASDFQVCKPHVLFLVSALSFVATQVQIEADTFETRALQASASASAVPAVVASDKNVPLCVHGPVRKWPARHLLRAVQASSLDRSLGTLQESVKRKLDFVFSGSGDEVWEAITAQGFACPDARSLARARINLDIAACGHERDVNLRRKLCWRQLNFDSSPKGGVELFGIREHVIENKDPSATTCLTWPLLTLGFGFSTAMDKTAALCHAMYLQAGPDLLQIRHLASSVYIVLTDQGVESSVVDARDCLKEVLGREILEDSFEGEAQRPFLFPNAMSVLDVNHLWDWVLQTTCQKLEFYTEFQKLSKEIGKCLTTQSYTDALVSILNDDADAAASEH